MKLNIGQKLSLMSLVVIAMVMFGFGVYDYISTKSEMSADLARTAKATVERLALVLTTPLWDLNEELVAQMLMSD